MTAAEIEIALARYFNYRRNIIVPNISWGFNFNHESDLLVITGAGYVTEIEIKVNKYDLIKDKIKPKWQLTNWRNKIKKFYFAIPYNLLHLLCGESQNKLYPKIIHIPDFAGILYLKRNEYNHTYLEISKYREAEINKNARKLGSYEESHIAHLGAMRIWDLKEKLVYNKKLLK